MISPMFKVCGKTVMLWSYVIHDYVRLALIAIPPFVTWLRIRIRVMLSGVYGFTYARGPIDPYST